MRTRIIERQPDARVEFERIEGVIIPYLPPGSTIQMNNLGMQYVVHSYSILIEEDKTVSAYIVVE